MLYQNEPNVHVAMAGSAAGRSIIFGTLLKCIVQHESYSYDKQQP